MEEGVRIKVHPRKKPRIEIIPLIDVVFFLLATFVLFTLSLNRIQSVPVDLPFAKQMDKSEPQPESKDMVTLQVSDQGNLYWNKEMLDIDELTPRLEQFKRQVEAPRVLVAGDDKAKWGIVVRVLDEIRKQKIEKLSMETRTRPTGK
jgi:biopolymer transport protein ExbD